MGLRKAEDAMIGLTIVIIGRFEGSYFAEGEVVFGMR